MTVLGTCSYNPQAGKQAATPTYRRQSHCLGSARNTIKYYLTGRAQNPNVKPFSLPPPDRSVPFVGLVVSITGRALHIDSIHPGRGETFRLLRSLPCGCCNYSCPTESAISVDDSLDHQINVYEYTFPSTTLPTAVDHSAITNSRTILHNALQHRFQPGCHHSPPPPLVGT
ncbi:uncharacterized protein BO66DRAFT_84847 [Aspergillus aculeatinus CBS 121060]|uniref:Uncharacterized protein n=1 Tax=Aspergillus aculeatinus CBS 121060 TaxID=1448322 RepID=A0ACD1H9C8_9EURO|nr:hypothetical protein BO66DRAFT_84847 [Aspergillus aculeatinus CBS 121060]RAH70264.1 hypothetical protein BO66DRAFT_84847 [Aspergillus aculeatinus CBS 121060]